MQNQISPQTKIAAFLFLVSGILNLMFAAIRFTVSSTAELIALIIALLSILVGIFLVKTKLWSYILGFLIATFILSTHLLVLYKTSTPNYYGLILSTATLILLITGKKDFKAK